MFCEYPKLVLKGEEYFHSCGTNGFHVKTENHRVAAAGSPLSSEAQIWKYRVVITKLRQGTVLKS